MKSIFDITSNITFTKGSDIFYGGTIGAIKNDLVYVNGRDVLIEDKDNYIFHLLKKEKLGIVFECDTMFQIDDFFDFLGTYIEVINDCDLSIIDYKGKHATIKNLKMSHINTVYSDEIIIDGGLILNNCSIACKNLKGYEGVPKLIKSKLMCQDFNLDILGHWDDQTYKNFDLYNKKFESIGLNQKSFHALWISIFYDKDKKFLYYTKTNNKSQPVIWRLTKR